MVKFLLEHMEKSGCTIGDRFIRAVHCNKQIAGGYVRGGGVRFNLSLSLSLSLPRTELYAISEIG